MTTRNPINCSRCNRPSYQVKLTGDLKEYNASEIYELLKNDVVGILHVAKKVNQPIRYLHFNTREKAAEFFYENEKYGYSNGDLFCLVKPPSQTITYDKPKDTHTSIYKRKLLESSDELAKAIKEKENLRDIINAEIDIMKEEHDQLKKIIATTQA